MGGTQSLHTNSLDEAYALPGEEAVTLALRTQQIIAHESGAPAVADPLGGSYFVEALTDEVEAKATEYMLRIDSMGGMIAAIERNFPQSEIANASYRFQRSLEEQERIIVGVNAYQQKDERPLDLLRIDERAEQAQLEKLALLRKERSGTRVQRALDELKGASERGDNTMPFLLQAVKAYATTGEICGAWMEVFGGWRETAAL
jgi:methylmalonyl-CoA mutase N-terminal domain/subunit